MNQLPVSLKETVLNNTAVKLVGINGISALKAQAGDLGIPITQLQRLFPFWFYLKYDQYTAKRMRSPDFLIKKFKKYSMNYKELKVMKRRILDHSTLYRAIHSNSYQTKYSKSDENSNQNYSTGNLDDKIPNLSQNFGVSTSNCKPEFKL